MDGENHVEIGKLIKEARKVINLTQDDLADLSVISVDTVRRIEAG